MAVLNHNFSAITLTVTLAFLFCLVQYCFSKNKENSTNNVSNFIDRQRQKLIDKGVSCPLKKLTVRHIENRWLLHQDDATVVCILTALQDSETQTNGMLWSVLGSLFTSKGKKQQASTCFKIAAKLMGKISHVKEWSFIGPFVVGKMELDGDPLEAFGGVRNVSRYRYQKSTVFYSELFPAGQVKWTTHKQKTATTMMKISSDINWNDLINSLGSLGITEWQGWVVGEFAVNDDNLNIVVQCLGFHTVYIDDIPLTGDVYHRDQYWYAMKLSSGVHTIYIKLRTKVTANFKCSFNIETSDFKVIAPSFLPDIYDGYLFGQYITIPVANYHHTDFLKVSKVTISQQPVNVKLEMDLVSKTWVAPGQIYPVVMKLSSNTDKILSQCSDIVLMLKLTTSMGVQSLPVTLRCRTMKQSVVFTFLDHDGSVQHAAAVHPIQDCPLGACPTVLTLHGTTVPPQNQADSYKRMEGGNFLFGVDHCWLLAPTRHGAHNWEGPGALTALSALENLAHMTRNAQWMTNKADNLHVIYAGHSMGGHGAWHLASHYPDRALALQTLAGWIKKEEYGDSNLFFRHDIATSHVDPAVKAVMEACIVENDADKHVSNLLGIPILARIGAQDRTVHPFFLRRMYRLLREVKADVSYTELDSKEHWWWDTWETNDGGVVNDQQLRDFINKHSSDHILASGQCDREDCTEKMASSNRYTSDSEYAAVSFRLTCYNPALGEGLHGVRILQQITPYRLSQIQGEVKDRQLTLKTVNVQRFSISHPPNRRIITGDYRVQVDNKLILESTINTLKEKVLHFCRNKGSWMECMEEDIDTKTLRGPLTLGPTRRIAEQPFIIIIGTKSSQSSYIQSAAVYISNLFFLTSDARATIVKDTDIDSSKLGEQNVILIGGPDDNHHTDSFLQALPLRYTGTSYRLSNCEFSEMRTGLLTLAPNSNGHLALILMGNSLEGLQDIVSLATPTIPPMTRSPFSNLLPDFVLTGPEFGWKGPGGFLCAGFWGNMWEYRSDLTSCACQL